MIRRTSAAVLSMFLLLMLSGWLAGCQNDSSAPKNPPTAEEARQRKEKQGD